MHTHECIITGCEFYDLSTDRWCHGDLFVMYSVGATFIFNCAAPHNVTWYPANELRFNAKVIYAYQQDVWDKRGVLIVPASSAQFSLAAIGYVAAHAPEFAAAYMAPKE